MAVSLPPGFAREAREAPPRGRASQTGPGARQGATRRLIPSNEVNSTGESLFPRSKSRVERVKEEPAIGASRLFAGAAKDTPIPSLGFPLRGPAGLQPPGGAFLFWRRRLH